MDDIKQLIKTKGLAQVLAAVAGACNEIANEHRETFHDERSAKIWGRHFRQIAALSTKVTETQ
jgi:hypothetical protein